VKSYGERDEGYDIISKCVRASIYNELYPKCSSRIRRVRVRQSYLQYRDSTVLSSLVRRYTRTLDQPEKSKCAHTTLHAMATVVELLHSVACGLQDSRSLVLTFSGTASWVSPYLNLAFA
jgi:hypothetical protein